jgi:type IV pilus assembly protein PilC
VDEAVENLMALLEPVMILFLGIMIGGIVISMYMPMFSLLGKIS